MATRTLQPSEYDIQREVEALRDIKRRSTTPGALTIDPDLPNQSPPSSPTGYRLGTLPSPDACGSSHPSDSPMNGVGSSQDGLTDLGSTSNNPADDPFHLFWVPAGLHPEIAPAEFRAFLKEHARSPPSSDGSSSSGGPNTYSLSSPSFLGRKKSMLSRQYRPSEHDGVENEEVVTLKRNRSSLYANQGPQLTINDLQKLEELAEEASESDDPSRLRNVLRRSLSMNVSPSALDKMDNIPDMGDEADAPIIVPPPGQILRRAARTKIRKPGLPGDGGGHRFGSTRRGSQAKAATVEPRTSSDISSSDHGDSAESVPTHPQRRTFSDEGHAQRPDSFSEEAIFDAYARDDDEETPNPIMTSSPPSPTVDLPVLAQPQPGIQPALLEALGPVILQPQPQRLLSSQPPTEYQAPPSRTPSPEASQPPPSTALTKSPSPPSFLSTTPSPPAHYRKEKDKKGLFGKWSSDKGGKKNGKEKDRVVEKEKDSGFFGSLFGGGSKKKPDQDYPSPVYGGIAGREAAQALLGASKSKTPAPSVSPAPSTNGNPYARYPIHVERAIYRLSHIKLANPRRPLYEQVLISNLMFWYLGVINKAQSPVSPNGQATGVQAAAGGQTHDQVDREQREAELAEQRERAEKERQERERSEMEQREIEMRKKESGRRGSLTKAPAPGSPAIGRRAEIPVKGPQYEMQHRVMEQEYGGQVGMPMGRSMSAPAGSGNGQQHPQIHQQAQFQQSDHFHYSPDAGQHIPQQQSRIPPGAMAPMDPSSRQSLASLPRQPSSPLPQPSLGPRRSRSPPAQVHSKQSIKGSPYNPSSSQENLVLGGVNRLPGRSLSATAGLPPRPLVNGKLRKGTSAHSTIPSVGAVRRPQSVDGPRGQSEMGEEEDMPLAVWQQQHRR